MLRTRTARLTTAALLAALLAASAVIAIPLGSVPVTLQVFVVVLIALTLPPGWAAGAVSIYLLVGAIGLPVFAGARGGLGVLAGPTGGYLLGFLAGVWIGAWVRAGLRTRVSTAVADGLAAVCVVAVVYVLGTTQLAVVTGMGALEAIAAGVAPFVVADVIKAVVAVGVASALRRAGIESGADPLAR